VGRPIQDTVRQPFFLTSPWGQQPKNNPKPRRKWITQIIFTQSGAVADRFAREILAILDWVPMRSWRLSANPLGRQTRVTAAHQSWLWAWANEAFPPSIEEEYWIAAVQEADALLVNGGDVLYLCRWMRESGLANLLPSLRETVYVGVSAGSMVTAPIFGETYDDPESSRANVERMAVEVPVPM
jgi:hypothetical protein